MVLDKSPSKLLFSMIAMFVFFAFISPLTSIAFVVLCALIVLSVFILDNSRALSFIMFASCFMACFNIPSMFLKMVDLTMALLLLKELIIAIRNKDKKNIMIVVAVLTFCLMLFGYSLCVANFKIYKWHQGFGILLTLATIYILEGINIKQVILYLSCGLVVSTICSVISFACGVSATQPYLIDSLCGIRFSGYFNYVNALALYCSLCQTAILTLFLTNNLEFKKWWWLVVVITTIGLSTFSKSFIAITLFTYFIVCVLGFVQSKTKKKYLINLFVGILIVGLLFLIFNSYITSILKRFYVDTGYGHGINTATTGRFEIWKGYIKYLINHPLFLIFGRGIVADGVGEFTPHNLFISILYRFGIVGILILLSFVIYVCKQAKLRKNINYYLPLLIVLINVCFEDISSSLFTCLPILVASMFVLKNKSAKV